MVGDIGTEPQVISDEFSLPGLDKNRVCLLGGFYDVIKHIN